MIEAHKIISNKEGLKREDLFEFATERGDPELLRGLKIRKKGPWGDRRQNTFSQRVANPWNDVLEKEEVQAGSTSIFKTNFDKEIGRRIDRTERVADGTLYNRLYRGRGFYSIFP